MQDIKLLYTLAKAENVLGAYSWPFYLHFVHYKSYTGGLFITIVGTFRSKTTCDVLEKLIAMKVS